MGCMNRRISVIAAVLLFCVGGAGAGKPRMQIRWAESWSDALSEAQALNLPIVVHRHGFY